MAGKYNFTIEQGTTFAFSVSWKDDTDALIDLTGYTARMQLRYGSNTGTVAIELTTENLGIDIDVLSSTITINITAVETSELEIKPCVYDLEMVKGENVTRLLEGKVKISGEVTK